MNATKKKFALHAATLEMARDEIEKHICAEDGEACFNLYAFLEAVSSRLDTIWSGNESPVGRFELDVNAASRYLWCCLALEGGDDPAGTKFRGMPILD